MSQGHRRQLRNYLLDWRYQIRYTLAIVITSTVLTAGLGWFWYDEARQSSRIMEIKELTTVTDDEAEAVQQEFSENDRYRLIVLIVFGILLSLALTGYGIVVSHKVAGPLYKIRRHMRDVKDGNLHPPWELRKGDQLHEFWSEFKEMHSSLRSRAEREISIIDESIAAIKKELANQPSAKIETALDELSKLREEKHRNLWSPSATLADPEDKA